MTTTTTPSGQGPIFIAGQERSGTSLIYALLGSHSRISMTRRLNWWTFFDRRYGDLSDDANLDRCLNEMMHYRRHLKLEPDPVRLRADFVAGPRTYQRLLSLLARQRADAVGKPRWGDKSLHTERYTERVFAVYPDSVIIHIMRDPRDRYASVLKRWAGRGGVAVASAIWNRTADLAVRHSADYPDRYMALKYEDLAQQPEEQLKRVCDLIGEAYEPQMLGMGADPDFREAGNSSYGEPTAGAISTSSIGRYRDVLSDWQIRYIQDRAGERLGYWDYEADATAMRPLDSARYRLIRYPSRRAVEAAWQARERVLDVRGRSPSSHTLVERT